MQIDRRIFNEINYVRANTNTFDVTSTNASDLNDWDTVEKYVIMGNPKAPSEDSDEYNQRISDEMASYPMLGIIPAYTLLDAALKDWQAAGHQLPLLSLGNGTAYADLASHCFLTRDSNYDPTNDLFQDYSGKTKQAFLDFINAEKN